jgi:hypothetical protein
MLKKIWNGVLGLLPENKLGKIIFYAFIGLFIGGIMYCWISHFLNII